MSSATAKPNEGLNKCNLVKSTYPTDHPLNKFKTDLLENFLGGPKFLKMNWIINFAKGFTPIYVVIMMNYYQNFSLGSYIYFVLHGSYGILWLVKDLLFPDKSFQVKQTIGGNFLTVTALMGYWSIGWQIFRGYGIQTPSMSRICACAFLYIFGVSLMLVADAQKYYTLKYKPGILISEGIFARNRNPNYLGEMCLYASFAALTGVLVSWIPLILMWSLLFASNMYLKDISLSRKQGGPEYIKSSYLFLFKVFDSEILNAILYTVFIAFLIYDYQSGGLISSLNQSTKTH